MLAFAKLNLGLHVLRRRADGFHDLETIFVRIGWADRVTVQPAATLRLTCSDPALPTDEGNLCMRAARMLADYAEVTEGAALHLEKHVPYGAGLGGGSSDAAATLRLLAGLWGLKIGDAELHALAAQLGSDVPFFLGPPVAYGTGRGEHLEPLAYTFPFTLVVAKPPVSVPTAAAYSRIQPNDRNRPALPALVASNDPDRWRAKLVNDFEPTVFAQYPVIAELKRRMYHAGADYASMSGSGSAVFGVFTDVNKATEAAADLEQPGYRIWSGPAAEGAR